MWPTGEKPPINETGSFVILTETGEQDDEPAETSQTHHEDEPDSEKVNNNNLALFLYLQYNTTSLFVAE